MAEFSSIFKLGISVASQLGSGQDFVLATLRSSSCFSKGGLVGVFGIIWIINNTP